MGRDLGGGGWQAEAVLGVAGEEVRVAEDMVAEVVRYRLSSRDGADVDLQLVHGRLVHQHVVAERVVTDAGRARPVKALRIGANLFHIVSCLIVSCLRLRGAWD